MSDTDVDAERSKVSVLVMTDAALKMVVGLRAQEVDAEALALNVVVSGSSRSWNARSTPRSPPTAVGPISSRWRTKSPTSGSAPAAVWHR